MEFRPTPRSAPVRGVVRVDGPSVRARRGRKAPMLFCLFGRIVMGAAKALQLAMPELLRVAFVRLYVVGDGGDRDPALEPAQAADRFGLELHCSPTVLATPRCERVPATPCGGVR